MPLPPEVRRARRAAAAKLRDPQKFPRRRCANCNKFFLKIRKNKRFCSRGCKTEFARYGSAFGPLKDYLTKLIESASGGEAEKQFAAYVAGKDFRRQLAAAGFIHRSMLEPRKPALTPDGLQSQITITGRLMRELESRVKELELYHLVAPVPRTPPGPGSSGASPTPPLAGAPTPR
jgi:hypothetical protein